MANLVKYGLSSFPRFWYTIDTQAKEGPGMNNVNKTLYIPLYGKAYVSRQGILLHDPKAEAIWAASYTVQVFEVTTVLRLSITVQ